MAFRSLLISWIFTLSLARALTPALVSANEINTFPDKFITARAYVDTPAFQVDIQSKVANQEVVWQPNLRTFTGVDVSINNFIGAGASWANNDNPGSAQAMGVTNFFDYRLGLTLKSFHADANFQQYYGFYVANTNQINPGFTPAGTDMQDSSMVAQNISVDTTFILNPDRFSYTAGLGQDARQEAWGGSLLFGLAASDVYFNTGNGLIPTVVRGNFGQDRNVTFMQFYSLEAKIGYGYTFAWTKKWFTTFVFNVGGGEEYRNYGTPAQSTQSGGATYKVDGLVSAGYNGDTFLIAFIATGDDTTYTTQSLQVPAVLGDVKLAIGGHF